MPEPEHGVHPPVQQVLDEVELRAQHHQQGKPSQVEGEELRSVLLPGRAPELVQKGKGHSRDGDHKDQDCDQVWPAL